VRLRGRRRFGGRGILRSTLGPNRRRRFGGRRRIGGDVLRGDGDRRLGLRLLACLMLRRHGDRRLGRRRCGPILGGSPGAAAGALLAIALAFLRGAFMRGA
jgi:hypothetical protein